MATDTKRPPEFANLTVSSKRQVTIPAAMARRLGLEAGDLLIAQLSDDSIVLRRRPKNLIEYLDSFPKGVYGRTKEEIDAYVRGERQGWARRSRIAEGLPAPEIEATEDRRA
jgi:AbrB family looped-hinge helix DNA binding protein